ncbi:LacI family transcriptional regulator, partial [Ralstonia pseudosolanacearum]
EEVALFDLAVDTPQCWEAQRRRIDEVVVKAREGKTRAIALT